ncbi:hypothetical protein [Streptomyces luteireticuli]|uniref:Uncharacterized protein n=1 Tax=Streptomyces luteireticuli TaxID=173858 RepID=A0ABP3IGR1_9ACTN
MERREQVDAPPVLVGVVDVMRREAVFALGVGLVGMTAGALAAAEGRGSVRSWAVMAVVAAAALWWTARRSRAWCGERLDAVGPVPPGARVMGPGETLREEFRMMALCFVVLVAGVVGLAYFTGLSAGGAVLAGMGAGRLVQVRRLVRRERELGVRLLRLRAPNGRVRVGDPVMPLLKKAAFYGLPAGERAGGVAAR